MNKEKIFSLLSNILEIDSNEIIKLPNNTRLEDIGLSSIQFIQFIVALEDEFQIEILDSDLLLSNFETLEMLLNTLSKYLSVNEVINKVLICDCDNVLWQGVAGEELIYLNDANRTFQKLVEDLYNRGILICLCSKNAQENIEAAWNSLPMILPFEHILISKINMNAKPTNIQEIAEELNLFPDSFVFVDDSIYELELTSSIIPSITTIHIDYSNDIFIEEIQKCFKTSNSNSDRSKQYKEQKLREANKKLFATVEEFNASLNSHIVCEFATPEQAKRLAELSQRTNQFNLSGKKYTEDQFKKMISDPNNIVLVVSISDKYGDMGLVGATIIHKLDRPVISDFYLSCRVFGRGLEHILLDKAKEICHTQPLGVYCKNDKNKRFENFYSENGVQIYEPTY